MGKTDSNPVKNHESNKVGNGDSNQVGNGDSNQVRRSESNQVRNNNQVGTVDSNAGTIVVYQTQQWAGF